METLLLGYNTNVNRDFDFKVGSETVYLRYNFEENCTIKIEVGSDNNLLKTSYNTAIYASKTMTTFDLFIRLFRDILSLLKMLNDKTNTVGREGTKEEKKTAYLTSMKMARVLSHYIFNDVVYKFQLTQEEIVKINKVAFRLYPYSFKKYASTITFRKEFILPAAVQENNLLRLKNRLSEREYNFLLNDLSKYHRQLGIWILDELVYEYLHILYNSCFKDHICKSYQDILKEVPETVKKNKYCHIERAYIESLEKFNPKPKTKWEWFCFSVIMNQMNTPFLTEKKMWGSFLEKLPKSNKNCWNYFKKHRPAGTKQYSLRGIQQMLTFILDGICIQNAFHINSQGVPFVKVEGSLMRMLRNSVFNHRQEQKIKINRLTNSKDAPLPQPQIFLPDWIEKIRIKTKHEMIKAGIECDNCIGSFTESFDIFVRDGFVCAQIDPSLFRVVQCYDTKDTITAESQGLSKRLSAELKKIKKSLNS